jgi:methylmalonyl-CoA/ethylmalonyl-CoA epimerase
MEFDHVGVATDDAAALASLFGDLFDAPVVHEEVFDGMQVVFLRLGGGGTGADSPTYLELLEPTADATEGPIARYLDREGPGIHHVAVRTPDVAEALATARALDVEPVDDEPRPGAWGHRVAFLHPGSTGGVLVEFVEHANGDGTAGTGHATEEGR